MHLKKISAKSRLVSEDIRGSCRLVSLSPAHVRMLQSLLCCEPFVRVKYQKFLQQIQGRQWSRGWENLLKCYSLPRSQEKKKRRYKLSVSNSQ